MVKKNMQSASINRFYSLSLTRRIALLKESDPFHYSIDEGDYFLVVFEDLALDAFFAAGFAALPQGFLEAHLPFEAILSPPSS